MNLFEFRENLERISNLRENLVRIYLNLIFHLEKRIYFSFEENLILNLLNLSSLLNFDFENLWNLFKFDEFDYYFI